MRCSGCWATAPQLLVTIRNGARRSKNRPASSSPTPSERSPSRPTSPSPTPRPRQYANWWPATGPGHTRPPVGRTSHEPQHHRGDTRDARRLSSLRRLGSLLRSTARNLTLGSALAGLLAGAGLGCFLNREQDGAEQVVVAAGGGFVACLGHDRALHLADQLGEFVPGEPECYLPVADQVSGRVSVLPVEIGVELGEQARHGRGEPMAVLLQ